MVTEDDIRKLLRAEPFHPFEVVLKSGVRYPVDGMLDMAIGATTHIAVKGPVTSDFVMYDEIDRLELRDRDARQAS